MQTTLHAPSVSLDNANYGGFWIRFVAIIIDGILLGIVQTLILFALGINLMALSSGDPSQVGSLGLYQVISMAVGFLYFVMMESSKNQGTLGKMVLGLKVVDKQGMQLSFGKAALRYVGKIVSSIVLLIGYLVAAFHPRKQALHDMIASTFVIKN